jgi:hypothetical protein
MGWRATTCAALAAFALVLVADGCGDDNAGGARAVSLVWKKPPRIYVPPTLKSDRILRGDVENGGFKKVRIEAADVKLLDRDGKQVPSVATFAPSYVHSLYAYNRRPTGGLPEEEKRRIGIVAEIKPGKSASLTVSWREPRGSRTPVRLDYGRGSLELPRGRHG